jgi:hypothetical protein
MISPPASSSLANLVHTSRDRVVCRGGIAPIATWQGAMASAISAAFAAVTLLQGALAKAATLPQAVRRGTKETNAARAKSIGR